MDHILPTLTPVALNSTYSWAEDVSQAPPTITIDLLFSMAQQTIDYIRQNIQWGKFK